MTENICVAKMTDMTENEPNGVALFRTFDVSSRWATLRSGIEGENVFIEYLSGGHITDVSGVISISYTRLKNSRLKLILVITSHSFNEKTTARDSSK